MLEELENLREEWKRILNKFRRSRKPKVLREEPSVEEMILRDRLERETKKLYTNDKKLVERAKQLSKVYKSSLEIKVMDTDPFEELSLYKQMEEITKRIIHLRSGGFIVIDTTEAMTVIDVNTASNIRGKSHRDLILRTNLEAAVEIARQIRLRNIGGIIVVDFISMKDENDKKKVIEVLRRETKKDRSKVDILGFTRLELLEMTRKRTTRSVESFLLTTCPVCGGSGKVIAPPVVFSRIDSDINRVPDAKEVRLRVHSILSGYLNSEGVKKLEKKHRKKISVSFDWCDPESYDISYILKGGKKG